MHNQYRHNQTRSASSLLLFTEQAGIYPADATFCQPFRAQGQDTMQLAILQLIKRHQHQSGWTLLIAPPQLPDRFLAECYELALQKVLVVHRKQLTNPVEAIKSALSSSTCSAVISFDKSLNPQQLQECQILAQQQQIWFYQLEDTTRHTFSH